MLVITTFDNVTWKHRCGNKNVNFYRWNFYGFQHKMQHM